MKLGIQKVMMIIFFTSTMLILYEVLIKERKFNQVYLLGVPPWLTKKRHRKIPVPPSCPMDDSACHNSQNPTGQLASSHVMRALHPPYSPNLSPCDFWLFGFLKNQ
jgi:hypothetical protein